MRSWPRCDRSPTIRSPWPGSGCPACYRSHDADPPFPDRAGQGSDGAGSRRHSMAPADRAAHQCFRHAADPDRACARVAGGGRRGSSAIADALVVEVRRLGGTIDDRAVDLFAGRAPPVHGRGAGHLARRVCAAMAGNALPAEVRRSVAAVPLRTGGLQDGLGPFRPGAVERGGVPSGRNRARRWHLRRGGEPARPM